MTMVHSAAAPFSPSFPDFDPTKSSNHINKPNTFSQPLPSSFPSFNTHPNVIAPSSRPRNDSVVSAQPGSFPPAHDVYGARPRPMEPQLPHRHPQAPPFNGTDTFAGKPPGFTAGFPSLAQQQAQQQQQQMHISQTPYGPHLPANTAPPARAEPQQQGEEISTIFVVGFPDDMSEREFQNMFTFSAGFEAATLKIPNKEPNPMSNGISAFSNGGRTLYSPYNSAGSNGANDPYNLVTVNQGGVVVDTGRPSLLNNNGILQSDGWGTDQQQRRQIIGFAKFRSRNEAIDARDVLQGRRIDAEKGAVLKAEMAKKNLHTKRGVGPTGPNNSADYNPEVSQQDRQPIGYGPAPNGWRDMGVRDREDERLPRRDTVIGFGPPIRDPLALGPRDNLPGLGTGSLNRDSMILGNGPPTRDNATTVVPRNPVMSRESNVPLSLGRGPRERAAEDAWQTREREEINWALKEGQLPWQNKEREEPWRRHQDIESWRTGNRDREEPRFDQEREDATWRTKEPGRDSNRRMSVFDAFQSSVSRQSSTGQLGSPTSSILSPTLPFNLIGSNRSVPHQSGLLSPTDPGFLSDESDIWAEPTGISRKLSNLQLGSARTSSMSPPPAKELSHSQSFVLPSSFSRQLPLGPQDRGSFALAAVSKEMSGNAYGFDTTDSRSTTSSKADGSQDGLHMPLGDDPDATVQQEEKAFASASEKESSSQANSSAGSPQLPSPSSSGAGRGAVDQNPPINTLYVGNLPVSPPGGLAPSHLEDALRDLFQRRPGYRKLCFKQKGNSPMCFVEFEDVALATKAMNELYGNTLSGFVKGGIRLSYSKNPLGVRTPTSGGSGSSFQQQQSSFVNAFSAMSDERGPPGGGYRNESGPSFSFMASPPPRFVSPPPNMTLSFSNSSNFSSTNSSVFGGTGSSSTFSRGAFSPFSLGPASSGGHSPVNDEVKAVDTFTQEALSPTFVPNLETPRPA